MTIIYDHKDFFIQSLIDVHYYTDLELLMLLGVWTTEIVMPTAKICRKVTLLTKFKMHKVKNTANGLDIKLHENKPNYIVHPTCIHPTDHTNIIYDYWMIL